VMEEFEVQTSCGKVVVIVFLDLVQFSCLRASHDDTQGPPIPGRIYSAAVCA
jgi:hypothetical protein